MILVDKPEIVQDVSYGSNLGVSNHVSIMIDSFCLPDQELIVFKPVNRNYHKGNYKMICSDLSSIDWKQIESLSADEGYTFIVNEIKNCCRKACASEENK